jgi:hypothetical protein
VSTARKNGLFENPANFRLPNGVGLDLENRRAVSRATLQKKLTKGILSPLNVYIPNFVVIKQNKKIYKQTKALDKRIQKENWTIVKPILNVVDRTQRIEVIEKLTETFKNAAKVYEIKTENDFKDIHKFFQTIDEKLKQVLAVNLESLGPYKFVLVLEAIFHLATDKDKIVVSHFYTSKDTQAITITNADEINQSVPVLINLLINKVQTYENNGSGWIIQQITSLFVKIVKFSPLTGSSYIPSPTWIVNKKCCVNVQNEDNQCFKYAVLSALHYNDVKTHRNRVSSYATYMTDLNFNDISFPMESTNYNKFEVLNDIPINVFGCDVDEDFKYDIEYISKLQNEKTPMNLLRIYNDEKSHYVWIKSLSAFVKTNEPHLFCCDRCLSKFTLKSAFENHIKDKKCKRFSGEALKVLPKHGEHINKFNNTKKMLRIPFVVYADGESVLTKVDLKKGDATNIYQHHKMNHIGCKLVSTYPNLLSDEYKQFDGENCVEDFLNYCFDTQHKAYKLIMANKPMIITQEQQQDFEKAKSCYLCEKPLFKDRARDHDHINGLYRGPTHITCNKNFNLKNFKLPVVFHNLKGYDSHFILSQAGKMTNKISCIPNTMEKYLSFTLNNCVFLDSLQFTLSSLESLVSSLNNANDESLFKNFISGFKCDNELKQLLRQKGVFPYDWFDNVDKLSCDKLPTIEHFYSKLNEENIKADDYERACEVWNKAECETFYDYLSIYLKCDVLLLADVFEEYRNTCLKHYKLDPCHYYTAPGLSWDAMLKLTDAEIECFSEGQEDMLAMVEKLRGGVSMITTRYAKANNKYMKLYDKNTESSYIMYLDANNLYGWAMSKKLPLGDFKWESVNISKQTIVNMTEEQQRGYLINCDLNIPTHLHDYFNDYPLLPEQTTFEPSPYMKTVQKDFGISEVQTEKLTPNLRNKTNYTLHYLNLKQALQMGVELVKVNQVLSFKQEAFLKPYIELNTNLRAKSKNDFEKNFFKLMNNSIFGKTCENVSKHIDVKLMSDSKKFIKMSSKPYFKDFRIFSNDLVACEMNKTTIKYNRPMIVGFCVLDISKTLMYDFHYNYIVKNYGEKAKLLFTDTDSLTYHIKTDDIYDDMKKNIQMFDTSDYPKDHPCFSTENKKVIGKFKDETNGKPIIEFCGLRSKMYSILTEEDHKATAKGVKKNVIHNLTHQEYVNAILGTDKKQTCSFNLIRSFNHQVVSMTVNKTSLCCYDDKRYVLDDNINTLAHGHHSIGASKLSAGSQVGFS